MGKSRVSFFDSRGIVVVVVVVVVVVPVIAGKAKAGMAHSDCG